MSSIRFPYDLHSEAALIELVRRDRPLDDIRDGFVTFGDLFFSPTPSEPGRTYVEMVNQRSGKKNWFIYRRLNIDQVLRAYLPVNQYYIAINLGTNAITPQNIVNEINSNYGLKLNHLDTDYSQASLTEREDYIYTLTMYPEGFAYYGQTLIYVNTTPPELELRMDEEGSIRLTEHNIFRVAE